MSEYYVESALLGQGLSGIVSADLQRLWPVREKQIVWMERGEYKIGDMEEFCWFREQEKVIARVNYQNFEECRRRKVTGVLTASGTMKVCELEKKPLAVTCGMGGLYCRQAREESHDLMALLDSGIALVATSPKDMFDLKWTITAMEESGIRVFSRNVPWCDGYIFRGNKVAIPVWDSRKRPGSRELLLNGIEESLRIEDSTLLQAAVAYGRTQEEFHPAVNHRLREVTKGQTDWLQLESMVENVRWAETMTT